MCNSSSSSHDDDDYDDDDDDIRPEEVLDARVSRGINITH